MPSKPKSDFKIVLGKKIRYLRKLNGMTQVQAMNALGYESTATLSLIERGKMGMTMDKIAVASKIFKVPWFVLASPEEMSDDEIEMYVNLKKVCDAPDHPHKSVLKESLRLAAKFSD